MDFADTSRVSYCFNDPRMSWLLANRGWTVDEWDPLDVDEMTLGGTLSGKVEIKIMSDNLHEIPQIFNLLTRFDGRVRRMEENYAFTCASQIAHSFYGLMTKTNSRARARARDSRERWKWEDNCLATDINHRKIDRKVQLMREIGSARLQRRTQIFWSDVVVLYRLDGNSRALGDDEYIVCGDHLKI